MTNLFELKHVHYPITIGEISANHDGSMERVLAMIEIAAKSGFDSIKFQTYTADEMTRPGLYTIPSGLWKGYDLYDLYKKGSTPREWHKDLFQFATENNILPFTTVFHPKTVEFVEKLGPAAYKIASFEITYEDLLREAASTNRPIIFSTGMATEREIINAAEIVLKYGSGQLFIMKCTSAYPASASQLNLRTMADMQRLVPQAMIGFSDHTEGTTASALAASHGAKCIEKHITLYGNDGLDSAFSLKASQYPEFINNIREGVDAMGVVKYGPTLDEQSSLIYRRSVHKVGDEELILRPSNGRPL
jgi:N-acetylneuraminate synthase